MIQNKKELKEYIEADQNVLGGVLLKQKIKALFVPAIWKFEKKMRVCEYYRNLNSFHTRGMVENLDLK